jgi:tetratricopeptide (TPR) repeat protein
VKPASQSVGSNQDALKNARRRRIGGVIVIILLTVLAYLPALSGKFIWDDDSWTTGIVGLLKDGHGLYSIWCQPTALQQYYPLSGTTFWLDYHLWGFHPLPYHVENLLLHIVSALLFWALLRRLQVPGAWLGGALFALHPVMVESVAWITERKNVLSLALYLGALLAYLRFTSRVMSRSSLPGAGTSPATRHPSLAYVLAFILFAAALLAKATAFSLPAVILVIGWWQRGRLGWRKDILPTLPFFTASIGFCLGTAWLEKNHVGAKGAEWMLTFPERCLIAGRVFWFYLGKLVWPEPLCFVYPRWRVNVAIWWQWLYPVTALAAVGVLWWQRNRIGRGPLAAVLIYVGTLFPVLGFMNAYFMKYSFVCDHWVYLSSLGLIALGVGLVGRIAERLHSPELVMGFGAVVLVVLGLLTWRQCGTYADIETLWQDTLVRNPGAWLAHNNLGIILRQQGRVQEAIEHYNEALQLNPTYALAYNNLGVAFKQMGKFEKAIDQYQQALRLDPDYIEARDNLGNALRLTGRTAEAIEQYELVLRLQPDSAEARYNLAIALKQQGKIEEAIRQYEQVLQINPDFFEAHCNLGEMLLQQGKIQEAVECYKQAVRIRPDSAEVHNDLAIALVQQGRVAEAIKQFEQALQLKLDYPKAQNSLAWQLATLNPAEGGDPDQAVILAERACELTDHQVPTALDTLATAYAAVGRFNDAIVTEQKALELARAAGQSQLIEEIETRLRLFQDGQPYHQVPTPVRGQSSAAENPSHP